MSKLVGFIIGVALAMVLLGFTSMAVSNHDYLPPNSCGINNVDEYGNTHIIDAVYYSDEGYRVEYVRNLIKIGAFINAQNNSGTTALMNAARRGHINMVKMLLQEGAKVNLQTTTTGLTALTYTAYHGHTDVIKVLLEAGADSTVVGYEGTAIQIAELYGFPELVKVLDIGEGLIQTKITSLTQINPKLIQINWSNSRSGATEFQLDYTTDPTGEWTSTKVSGESSNFYLYNLDPNQTYFVRIRAKTNYTWGKYQYDIKRGN